jgi:hypothetical protein
LYLRFFLLFSMQSKMVSNILSKSSVDSKCWFDFNYLQYCASLNIEKKCLQKVIK